MAKVSKRRLIPGIVLAVFLMNVTAVSTNAMSEQPKEVDLTVNNETTTIKTNAKTIQEVLISVEYEHKDSDKVNYELDDKVLEEMEVVVSSEKEVNLSIKGDSIETSTNANTVAEFLREVDVEVSEDDIVIPSLDSKLNEEEEVAVIFHEEEEYKTSDSINYETREELSFDVAYGEIQVVKEGQEGKLEKTYNKTTRNDILISDEKFSEEIIENPVDEEVIVGTKEVINKSIDNKVDSRDNSSMFKGETKVIQEGNKGNEQTIYKNDGKDRELVSTEITKDPVDRIIEEGTKVKPKPKPVEAVSNNSSAQYTLAQFKFHGVVNSGGKKYTYYSQSVLPGGGLKIPGRHVNAGGYVADSSGYIVVATNRSIPKGSIVSTPFGYQGKVYDVCEACSPNWIDIYTK